MNQKQAHLAKAAEFEKEAKFNESQALFLSTRGDSLGVLEYTSHAAECWRQANFHRKIAASIEEGVTA